MFRANILINDEFRMIDKEVLDSVLKPFLTNELTPPFHVKPKYINYPKLHNKEIYLSSAWLKSHWSWDKFVEVSEMMLKNEDNKPAFSCVLNYHTALDCGLVTQEKLDVDRVSMGEFKFEMEYGAKFFGENENSFYKSSEINECRVLKKAFYPLSDDDYRNPEEKKKKIKQYKRKDGEIRILSADIAVQASGKNKNNDNAVYTVMRLLPDGNRYIREVVHMESHDGMKPTAQAIRIKRLFTEMDCDKMIIDVNGLGISVLEELQKSSYDNTIDEHYPPFSVYDCNVNSDYEKIKDSINCIYMMKAYQKDNSRLIVGLKNAFVSKKIRLLVDENNKQLDYSDNSKFHKDGSYQAEVLLPHVQTSQFIFETLNLEYEVMPNGDLRVKEKSGKRKDRFSSVGYANFLADEMEREYIRGLGKKKSNFIFIS